MDGLVGSDRPVAAYDRTCQALVDSDEDGATEDTAMHVSTAHQQSQGRLFPFGDQSPAIITQVEDQRCVSVLHLVFPKPVVA